MKQIRSHLIPSVWVITFVVCLTEKLSQNTKSMKKSTHFRDFKVGIVIPRVENCTGEPQSKFDGKWFDSWDWSQLKNNFCSVCTVLRKIGPRVDPTKFDIDVIVWSDHSKWIWRDSTYFKMISIKEKLTNIHCM